MLPMHAHPRVTFGFHAAICRTAIWKSAIHLSAHSWLPLSVQFCPASFLLLLHMPCLHAIASLHALAYMVYKPQPCMVTTHVYHMYFIQICHGLFLHVIFFLVPARHPHMLESGFQRVHIHAHIIRVCHAMYLHMHIYIFSPCRCSFCATCSPTCIIHVIVFHLCNPCTHIYTHVCFAAHINLHIHDKNTLACNKPCPKILPKIESPSLLILAFPRYT